MVLKGLLNQQDGVSAAKNEYNFPTKSSINAKWEWYLYGIARVKQAVSFLIVMYDNSNINKPLCIASQSTVQG